LPLSYPLLEKPKISLHLYTLPSHDLWPNVLNTLVTGLDGCVFVFDSRQTQYTENERHIDRIQGLFFENGVKDLSDVPFVCQCNHRDSEMALPMNAIKECFKDLSMKQWIEGVAVQDIGVVETLEQLVMRVLNRAIPNHRFSDFSLHP
jgi:signal recognition particle receptor subunit beta